jgi:uncharacterized protein
MQIRLHISKFRKKVINKFKTHFDAVLETKKSPHSVAWGFAIGTFISNMPTPGFNLAIGALTILIFTRINKYALFAGILFWNPLITPFTYALSFKIGNNLLANSPVIQYTPHSFEAYYHFSRRFLLGSLILSLGLSTLSYAVAFLSMHYIQKKTYPK